MPYSTGQALKYDVRSERKKHHASLTVQGLVPKMMSGQNVRNTMHASQYKDRSSNDVRSECKKHHACLTEQGQVPKMMSGQNVRNTMHASQNKDKSPK